MLRARHLAPLLLVLSVACGGRTPIGLDDESINVGVGGTSEPGGAGGAPRWDDFGSGGIGNNSGGDNGLAGSGGTGGRDTGTGGRNLGTGGLDAGSGGRNFGTGGGDFGTGGGDFGTGGGDPGCSSDTDCAQANQCLVGSCVMGSCVTALRDRDRDGFADNLCGGRDCNDLNAGAYPGASEDCRDGSDNDCNGVADCFDPSCSSDADCGCVSSPEVCSGGIDEDCDGAVDCNDPDCVGQAACGCGDEQCSSGSDDDCDGRIDCEDPDCFGADACTCQATAEICSNGEDEDCDGFVDCADSDCAFSARCLCLIPSAENCSDGRDNDCNGLVDCGDPSCFSNSACGACSPEVCTGGGDEDCDGKIDCADPSCAFDPECPATAELCNNQRDDDFDGLIDCDDQDCVGAQLCVEQQNTCETARRIEPLGSASYVGDTSGQLSNFRGTCGGDAGEAVFRLDLTEPTRVELDTIGTSFDSVLYVRTGACEFGLEIGCDDDSGGVSWSSALVFEVLAPGSYFVVVDGLTVDPRGGPNEGPYVLNVETSPPTEVCDDGVDNDGNGLADCVDPQCASFGTCSVCNGGLPAVTEFGPGRCTDGLDNDCDGDADCDDDDCSASEENITECCTGTDQNGNGIPDDFNCRCVDDGVCPGQQICYTSTLGTCGIRCDRFFGEICPFVAPGSTCNIATGQCEF